MCMAKACPQEVLVEGKGGDGVGKSVVGGEGWAGVLLWEGRCSGKRACPFPQSSGGGGTWGSQVRVRCWECLGGAHHAS